MKNLNKEIAYIPELCAAKLVTIREFDSYEYPECDYYAENKVVLTDGKLLLIVETRFSSVMESLARQLLDEKSISLLKKKEIKTYEVLKMCTL